MMPSPLRYFDHAATTPLHPQVREAMLPYLGEEAYGNPSSLHRLGAQARTAMEQARQRMADLLHCQPQEITWTSGGTEANNLAIFGIARHFQNRPQKHLITTPIEHPCILNPCRLLEELGWEVTYLPVDHTGRVSPEAVAQAIRPHTVFASIMQGNNEIGTLQPLAEIGPILAAHEVFFHTDAVQTVGKIPVAFDTLPVDALTLSAHKIYGPKGVGALLVKRDSLHPLPLLLGGGQESGQRSGTENVAGIVGMAEALAWCVSQLPHERTRLHALQEQLIQGITERIPSAILNGPRHVADRVPGNVNFSFPPLQGESLILKLDLKGIAASSGSACHSAVIEPSHVVLATGQPPSIAQSTVRFSMGRTTQPEDVEAVLSILPRIVDRLLSTQTPSDQPA
jgi:cysteine desulfurase